MKKALVDKIQELPHKPGVYQFFDAKGFLLYVGKANKLKNRVGSYFKKDAAANSPRIQIMISQIADVTVTIVNNEVEALILENNFIKKLKPKYNVQMRDDKNYIFLKINITDEIPTIEYQYQRVDKSARYFGPYTSSLSIKDTLRLLRRVFPYCANSKVSDKPCFYYHIGKCPGVCFGKISLGDYHNGYIKKIIQFLDGKQLQIVADLKKEMKFYATHKQFEKAAHVRDQVFALNRVLERQKLVYPTKVNQDVFAMHCDLPAMPDNKLNKQARQAGSVASINLFMIREGKLVQKENFILENTRQVPQEEILKIFLENYYMDATNLPKEILVPFSIDTKDILNLLKTCNSSSRIYKITVPMKGERLKLLKLGELNAKQHLESQSDKHLLEEARLLASLKELQRVLNLPELPARMECFDISNIQGTSAVGSMVVFDYAHPKKDQYRKFKIQRKDTPDDFAMMSEMLERRFRHSALSAEVPTQKTWPLPNLIIIDGGKGQLSAAIAALKISSSKFLISKQIPMIGLAKRLEEIFIPGRKNPIILPANSSALFLLQRIRDEAHRFAITYHRKLRSKSAVASVLDQIKGIGPAKKKLLLKKFGSAARIRQASITEIAEVVGNPTAEKIKASL